MKTLTDRIEAFQKISEQLEPSAIQRNTYNQQVENFANQFIDTIHDRNAYHNGKVSPGSLSIQTGKKSLEELLEIYRKEVNNNGINPASGGHIGYIPGGGIFAAALGDYLAD